MKKYTVVFFLLFLLGVPGEGTWAVDIQMNGFLSGTSFSGDGSALTNLNPGNIAAGTAGINISGNAATATTVTRSWME